MYNKKVSYQVIELKRKEIWPLEEVKNYLRVSYDYDDRLITDLITTAVESAELFTSLSLNFRKVVCSIPYTPGILQLKYIPVVKILKVELQGNTMKETENITDDYGYVNLHNNTIYFNPQYTGKVLEIEYNIGYEHEIPRNIQYGILLHIKSIYDNADKEIGLSTEIKDLYYPYRPIKI